MLAKTRVEGLECFNLHANACSFSADVDTEVAVRCVHHNKHPGSALHDELPGTLQTARLQLSACVPSMMSCVQGY